LLRGFEGCVRALKGRGGQVAVLCRNLVFGEELLHAIVVELLLLKIGLGVDHRLPRCLQLLLAQYPLGASISAILSRRRYNRCL
jgi:hypothetical protein